MYKSNTINVLNNKNYGYESCMNLIHITSMIGSNLLSYCGSYLGSSITEDYSGSNFLNGYPIGSINYNKLINFAEYKNSQATPYDNSIATLWENKFEPNYLYSTIQSGSLKPYTPNLLLGSDDYTDMHSFSNLKGLWKQAHHLMTLGSYTGSSYVPNNVTKYAGVSFGTKQGNEFQYLNNKLSGFSHLIGYTWDWYCGTGSKIVNLIWYDLNEKVRVSSYDTLSNKIIKNIVLQYNPIEADITINDSYYPGALGSDIQLNNEIVKYDVLFNNNKIYLSLAHQLGRLYTVAGSFSTVYTAPFVKMYTYTSEGIPISVDDISDNNSLANITYKTNYDVYNNSGTSFDDFPNKLVTTLGSSSTGSISVMMQNRFKHIGNAETPDYRTGNYYCKNYIYNFTDSGEYTGSVYYNLTSSDFVSYIEQRDPGDGSIDGRTVRIYDTPVYKNNSLNIFTLNMAYEKDIIDQDTSKISNIEFHAVPFWFDIDNQTITKNEPTAYSVSTEDNNSTVHISPINLNSNKSYISYYLEGLQTGFNSQIEFYVNEINNTDKTISTEYTYTDSSHEYNYTLNKYEFINHYTGSPYSILQLYNNTTSLYNFNLINLETGSIEQTKVNSTKNESDLYFFGTLTGSDYFYVGSNEDVKNKLIRISLGSNAAIYDSSFPVYYESTGSYDITNVSFLSGIARSKIYEQNNQLCSKIYLNGSLFNEGDTIINDEYTNTGSLGVGSYIDNATGSFKLRVYPLDNTKVVTNKSIDFYLTTGSRASDNEFYLY